jgi:hypothetical protein
MYGIERLICVLAAGTTPIGVDGDLHLPPRVGVRPTLGFEAESPWDSLQLTLGRALGSSRSRGWFYVAVPAWLSFGRSAAR